MGTAGINWKSNSVVYLTAFIISLVTFIVFSPSFKCGFTNYDDQKYIVQNHLITSKTLEVKKIFTSVVTENDYYPITILTYALNFQFGKLDPFGFHFLNVLFHVFNTFLVFMFVFFLTKRNLLMASIVAIFFGIHPQHVESVTWITERKDVLFMFFFLIGLITYMRYRESRKTSWYAVTLLLFILSCLSKGTAVVFPGIILLIDFLLSVKLNKEMFIEKIPFFLVSITFVIITYLLHKTGTLRFNEEHRTFIQKIIFASYDTLWYIVKLVFPTNLQAFYLAPDLNAIPLIFYLSPFILLGLLLCIYFYFRKNKAVLFGLLFYFFSIVLMLQFIPTGGSGFIMADRYNYLPSVGLLFIIAHYINIALQKKNFFKYLSIGFTVVYFFVFSYQTYARTLVWLTSETLWTDMINHDPNSYFAYINRGQYYQDELHDEAKALADYGTSLRLKPNFAEGYNNRGILYLKHQQYDLALSDCEKAVMLNPYNYEAFNNRGTIYLRTGQLDLALTDFNDALKLSPDYASAYFNRGSVYFQKNNFDLALIDYRKALQLDPDNAVAYTNRGIIFDKQGEFNLAISDYNKALELKPDFAEAYRNRGILYDNHQQDELAISDYNNALKYNPTYADVYNNRGVLYVKQNKYDLAMADYMSALKLNPDYSPAYYNRGIIYSKKNQYDSALDDYTKAIKINKDYADAYNNRGILFGKHGKLDFALADFTKATQINPANGSFWLNRSKTENNLGNIDEARNDALKAKQSGVQIDVQYLKKLGIINQ